MAAEEGLVIACQSVDDWKLRFDKAKDSGKLVVIYFTAVWCGPCRMIAPTVAQVAKKMTDIIFLKVDVDKVEPVAEEYKIQATPTFIFIKEGKVVHEYWSSNKEALYTAIANYK